MAPAAVRRVLVANRGEIAVRIIRACRELGIEIGRGLQRRRRRRAHVRPPTRRSGLGPAPAAESYLRVDAIIDAALATGAEAIHPGYGFLSERAAFARAVRGGGHRLRRPVARDDRGARRQARGAADGRATAGVPVVPGTFEPAPVDRPDRRRRRSSRRPSAIGFPLLVKAAAGGGGRGMRRVDAAARSCRPRWPPARARRPPAFGDGAVYLEREIEPARHVEVQLLGDADGTIVALGERDCSLQRRHQKLVEEAPAPGPDAGAARATLHEMAVRVAAAAGLRNAATAEFLLDPDGEFWFLEVNTRLQVEHGVTELVTGIDIVREQLWIAAGRAARRTAVAAAAERAADPTATRSRCGSRPRTRRATSRRRPAAIGRWAMPAGPGRPGRHGVEAGERVPPDYDPLIAKLMVVAADRPAAIDRLRRALDEIEIGGIQTTLPFHRFVARDPAFRRGDAVDRLGRRALGRRGRRARAPARPLLAARPRRVGRPADRRDAASQRRPRPRGRRDGAGTVGQRPGSRPWRDGAGIDRWPAMTRPAAATACRGRRGRRVEPSDGPTDRDPVVGDRRSTWPWTAEPAGHALDRRTAAGPRRPRLGSVAAASAAARRRGPPPARSSSTAGGSRSSVEAAAPGRAAGARTPAAAGRGTSGPTEVRAIIPGGSSRVGGAGDAVEAGQQLLVVEAMKMQNELRAPAGRHRRAGRGRGGPDGRDRRPARGDRDDRTTGPDRAADRPGRGRPDPGPRALARDDPRQGPDGGARAPRAVRDDARTSRSRDLYTPADIGRARRGPRPRPAGRVPRSPAASRPTMYRGRLWTMRQYAASRPPRRRTSGSATSSSRARPACRSPSTCRPRWATTRTRREAEGEVGRVGVPIAQPRRHGDPVRRHPARARSPPR